MPTLGQTPTVSVADPPLDAVIDRLVMAGCITAEKEAAEFLAAAPDETTLEAWLCRREQGEPPAWIMGRVVFCGQALHIAPGVYVPRSQTEELARRAATRLPDNGRALDLCTGAGAVAAYLLAQVPTAAVIGIDRDVRAAVRAAVCARRNGVPTAVADLAEPLANHRQFDLVTAVAPYVPTQAIRLLPADVQRYEPTVALDGGADGLNMVRRVIAAASRLLVPGGWLLLEVGGNQDNALAPTLRRYGFDTATAWWDDDGDLRGIASRATSGER